MRCLFFKGNTRKRRLFFVLKAFYSLGKAFPFTFKHFWTLDIIPWNAWVIWAGWRLLQASIIAFSSSSSVLGCWLTGFVQMACFRWPQRKKSQIARSGERGGQGQSPRLLISFPGNRPRRYAIDLLLVCQLHHLATTMCSTLCLWESLCTAL